MQFRLVAASAKIMHAAREADVERPSRAPSATSGRSATLTTSVSEGSGCSSSIGLSPAPETGPAAARTAPPPSADRSAIEARAGPSCAATAPAGTGGTAAAATRGPTVSTHADQQCADQCAADRADAADDDHHERENQDVLAHANLHREQRPEHRAGDRAQAPRRAEHHREQPLRRRRPSATPFRGSRRRRAPACRCACSQRSGTAAPPAPDRPPMINSR